MATLSDAELEYLRANPRFLAREMQRRGVEIEVLDWENQIFEARFGGHIELMVDINASCMPYAPAVIATDKAFVKQRLRQYGISVPVGMKFSAVETDAAAEYARSLGYPLVVKPCLGIQGELVQMDLESEQDVQEAMAAVLHDRGPCDILVERQCPGSEYRVFVTRRGAYAVLHRDPAHVIGDGERSIEVLANEESFRRMTPRKNCLCEVALDQEVERFLRRSGRTLASVPAAGEKVYLRRSSNVKLGGVCEDFTDRADHSVIEIARKVLAALPGLPYAGIDFMSTDITKPQTAASYSILEVNSMPGIGMHMAPAKGKPRNVAGMIVDLIFPETAESPIRLAA